MRHRFRHRLSAVLLDELSCFSSLSQASCVAEETPQKKPFLAYVSLYALFLLLPLLAFSLPRAYLAAHGRVWAGWSVYRKNSFSGTWPLFSVFDFPASNGSRCERHNKKRKHFTFHSMAVRIFSGNMNHSVAVS